jgi:soluble lytic murein transglycosylase
MPLLASALSVLLAALVPAAPTGSASEVHVVTISEADARPVFGQSSLAGALRAFDEGRWEEAARGFAASHRPEARFLRGLALVFAGRGEEAAGALAALEARLPAIADRIRFWRGQALALGGRRQEAADLFGGVPRGSLLWAEAQVARARALHALGHAEAAVAALEPVAAQPPPPDLSHPDWSATALLLSGEILAGRRGPADQAAARQSFSDCWAGHPLAPESKECLERMRALGESAGGPPTDEMVLRRAEALLEANRNEAAIADIARYAPRLRAAAAADGLGCRARFIEGRAYRKGRLYAKALDALRPVVELCQDATVRVRALYVLASAGAVVDPDAAVRDYLRLAREFPDHSLADDAMFFAADLLARGGKVDEARRTLAQLAERYPRGDYRPEALFRIAWLAKRQGDLEGAIATLARIEQEYQGADAYEAARAAYWRARLLAGRGGKDLEAGRAIWASLATRYPTDYYGLLARVRLEEGKGDGIPPAPALELPSSVPEGFRYLPGPLADDPHFKAGLLLLRMGLSRAAADELNAVDKRFVVPGPGESGADPLLLVAELLDRASDHKSAHHLLRTLGRNVLRQRPEGANLRVWRVAYPAAYRAEVQRWAPPAGVPVDLLHAVMREESALDPLVVSPAGAIGITQLMIPTAQSVAKRLKLRRPSQSELMGAPLNIRLGAAYLGELLHRFGGSAPLAVAAYNAGDSAVRGWLKARGDLALDEFVEEIPIQETRGYVKRVMRSYAAYRFLYGRSADSALVLGQKLPTSR